MNSYRVDLAAPRVVVSEPFLLQAVLPIEDGPGAKRLFLKITASTTAGSGQCVVLHSEILLHGEVQPRTRQRAHIISTPTIPQMSMLIYSIEDYFDAGSHPSVLFEMRLSRLSEHSNDTFTGDLMLAGVTVGIAPSNKTPLQDFAERVFATADD